MDAKEYLARAYRLQMSGHLDEAIESYDRSIAIEATAEAYTFRGWAKSIRKEYDAAISDCRKAIDLDPDFGNPYNDIGAYLIQQGRLDEAETYLMLAIGAKRYATPEFPHYNLGRIYERRGRWFEALAFYRQSLALQSDYKDGREAYFRLQAILN
jgi:Tfp pilus assembly protein PilF